MCRVHWAGATNKKNDSSLETIEVFFIESASLSSFSDSLKKFIIKTSVFTKSNLITFYVSKSPTTTRKINCKFMCHSLFEDLLHLIYCHWIAAYLLEVSVTHYLYIAYISVRIANLLPKQYLYKFQKLQIILFYK